MRIGIDARLWNETGVGRYIRNLVWNLGVLDKKNDYVLFVKSEFTIQDLKFKSDKWKLVPTSIQWHSVSEQIQFPKLLDKENLDLVHFPYFSVPVLYNKPYVITIHDMILHHFSTGQASTLPYPLFLAKLQGYKFVIQNAAKKAWKIIAVSNATKKEITNHLKVNHNKIVVIYEGIDKEIFQEETKVKVQLKHEDFFLYVGNAYPHKNLETLITAFEQLQKESPELALIFVGKDDYFYKRIKKLIANKKLENSVEFLTHISDNELAYLYKKARALVMPSFMEGFGLPIIEAMANDCLVLASDIPAHKEVAAGGALFFDPYSVQDLEIKMKDLVLNAKSYKNLKEKALDISKDYSWHQMAKETLVIYESSSPTST